MFLRQKPTDKDIAIFLAAQQRVPLSYAPAGLTKTSPHKGYKIDITRINLGRGAATFHAAMRAVQQWKMFDLAWLELFQTNTPIAPDAVVAIVVHHLGFWSMNACRVVYVMDEEDDRWRRYGFAYGTLRDHAERGEERFMIEWDKHEDTIWYDILAVSRPGLLARLGYWYARRLQRRFATDSACAMADAVRSAR